MTALENSIFVFKRLEDTFKLINKTNIDRSFTLYQIKDSIEIELETNILLANTFIFLPVGTDGYYKLDIDGYLVFFNNWKNLRKELINQIRKSLCVSCSNTCEDKANAIFKMSIKQQSLLNFVLTYKYFIKPYSFIVPIETNTYIDTYLNQYNLMNRDKFLLRLSNQLLKTCITGETNSDILLFNYQVAGIYLSLYLNELSELSASILTSTELDTEILYINKVYDYKIINDCIKTLGLDTVILPTLETESKTVYYYMSSLDESNVSILSDVENSILTADNIDYDTALQGFVLPINSTGKLIIVIKPTISLNFILLDALGNNITSLFDSQLILTNTVVFISKANYTLGTTYIKIKSIF